MQGPEHHTAEVVCQSDKGGIITSGGGFSMVYPTPSWQRDHVQRYLQDIGTGESGTGGVPGRGAPIPGFHTGGRGYPDVSALAFNYVIAVNHNFTAGEQSLSCKHCFLFPVIYVSNLLLALKQCLERLHRLPSWLGWWPW